MWKRLKYRCLAISEELTLERRKEEKGQKVTQETKWIFALRKRSQREKG